MPTPKTIDINFIELAQKSPLLLETLMETLAQSGAILMFNRLASKQEVTWNSVPYVFPGHKVRSVPLDVARHAIKHSQCYYTIGEEGQEEVVEDWFLVPYGYETFCKPVTVQEEDQILDPVAYMDLDNEANFLPPEGDNGKPKHWRRVRRKSIRPRSGARPVIYHDGVNAMFNSVGGA